MYVYEIFFPGLFFFAFLSHILAEVQPTHSFFVKEFKKLSIFEDALNQTLEYLQHVTKLRQDQIDPEEIEKSEQKLQEVIVEADNLIQSYKDKIEYIQIPLVLNTTINPNAKETKSSLIDQFKQTNITNLRIPDTNGVYVYFKNPTFVFFTTKGKPKAAGFVFAPTTNHSCESKIAEFNFFRDSISVQKKKIILQRSIHQQQFNLTKPIKFSKVEVSVIENYGDENITCLPKFDVYNVKD